MGREGGLDGSQQPGRWTQRTVPVLLSRLHLITLHYVFFSLATAAGIAQSV
jgi:hypothetical protein